MALCYHPRPMSYVPDRLEESREKDWMGGLHQGQTTTRVMFAVITAAAVACASIRAAMESVQKNGSTTSSVVGKLNP